MDQEKKPVAGLFRRVEHFPGTPELHRNRQRIGGRLEMIAEHSIERREHGIAVGRQGHGRRRQCRRIGEQQRLQPGEAAVDAEADPAGDPPDDPVDEAGDPAHALSARWILHPDFGKHADAAVNLLHQVGHPHRRLDRQARKSAQVRQLSHTSHGGSLRRKARSLRIPCQTSGVPATTAALVAPHFANGRFFNPWGVTKASFFDLVRWKLLSRNPYDKSRLPRVPQIGNDGASLRRRAVTPEVTWIGHATFAVHDGDSLLLTDPHFGPRALVPRRFQEPGIPLAAIPEGAVAVLSHNHYDHLDRFTLARLPKGMAWVVPLGLGNFVRRFGFAEVEELDWWQTTECRGFRLTLLPAQHWSRRLSQRDETTLWGSWLIEGAQLRTFFAGDSGYFHGFAEFGRRYPGLDLALLPSGAYEPRWFMKPVHLNPEEALSAFRDLGAREMVPMHWGTFDLTDEPIDEADRVLERLLIDADPALARRVHRLAIGESLRLPATP